MLIERACAEVPSFDGLYRQLLTNIRLNGQSESTLANYAKCIAKLSLYFGCTPLELRDDQINDYLLMLRDHQIVVDWYSL